MISKINDEVVDQPEENTQPADEGREKQSTENPNGLSVVGSDDGVPEESNGSPERMSGTSMDPEAEKTESEEGDSPEVEADASDDADDEDESEVLEDEDFRARIWKAEHLIREKEAVVEELKEDLKEAKASYDKAVSNLRRICQEAEGDANRPLFDKKKEGGQSSATEGEESVLNGWDDQPISILVDRIQENVKGFGQKKIDAFNDKFSTFADFERVRTDASMEGVPLHNYMPKGIGDAMTSEIEELYLSIVVEPFTKPEPVCPLRKRADDLIADDDLAAEFDQDVWNEGWDAWEANVKLAECPYLEDDPESRDEWIRGWVSCDQAPEAGDGESGESDSEGDEPSNGVESPEADNPPADAEPAESTESIDDVLAEL